MPTAEILIDALGLVLDLVLLRPSSSRRKNFKKLKLVVDKWAEMNNALPMKNAPKYGLKYQLGHNATQVIIDLKMLRGNKVEIQITDSNNERKRVTDKSNIRAVISKLSTLLQKNF